jgi:hypothetical protein
MYTDKEYNQIQTDMHMNMSAYVQVCGLIIHSDTFKYAQYTMCISECIQTKNTIRYKQICTST